MKDAASARQSRKPPLRTPASRSASSADTSDPQHSLYTIGKLAALMSVSSDTLRYYEREHLLAPRTKSSSGYRLYDEDAAQRVQFIRHAQECGFTLAEIRELLTLRGHNSACCSDVKRVAIDRKLQLEARIRTMKKMSAALDRLIGACDNEQLPVEACPILMEFEREDVRR